MSEAITVTYERVDDLPLLLTQLKSMGVQQLLDKHFPTRRAKNFGGAIQKERFAVATIKRDFKN